MLSLTATATAQTEMIPTSRNSCNIAILQPKGGSTPYFSQDCKAAFVLPPSRGKVKVERVHSLSNLRLCPTLYASYARHGRYSDMLEKLYERLGNERLNAQQREDLRKDAELLQKAIDDVYKNLDGVPGAVAQVSYTMPEAMEWLGQYLMLNPNTMADYQLKFHLAPIAEGVLTISSMDSNNKVIPLNPVVRADLSGLRPINNDPNRLSGTGILSTGNSSGQLTLSLTGACEYNKGNQADKQDLVAHMVANFTYAVPVHAAAGYTANLDTDIAIRNWTHSWQTRSQFSKNQAATLVSSGTAGEAFKFNINEYPGNVTSQADRDGFYQKLREEVRGRLAGRLVDQMVGAGFLEMSKPAEPANAADPGYLDEVRTRRECSFNSGFLGIGARGGCSNIPYVVKVPYSTSADVYLHKVNNTNFTNSETVTINTVIHHTHTSTFLPEE